MENNLPSISVYMATLNAEATLEECLSCLALQDYPKDKIELIVGDGGSTDSTISIINKYGGKVFANPLKTAESGKAVALREAKNELALTLDSDNFLPDSGWLRKMVAPFMDAEIMLAEPIKYTWRREGGYIERYCALIGMNDPVCLFLGNYDRWNYLTKKWTEVPHEEKDLGGYLRIKLTKKGIPTVGANGTIFRTNFLKSINTGKYLFDIDVIAKEISEKGFVHIAKVKVGIIHTFCEANFGKFIRKQKRRIRDYTFHKKNKSRVFDWSKFEIGGEASLGLLQFLLYTILIFPLLIQALIGYSRKKDPAWFFHIPACWVTLIVYTWGKFVGIFSQAEMSRENWKQ
ncbi:MAG: glycosyltransferase family 2 protein [Candidatus Moranbacteria bacterium]|nr:glycosyltransferase family 2 protein [Candidatus Moranbacteria bacterium]